MSITLLFDLDDTLLTNSMATFVPAYLNLLAEALRDQAEPEALIEALLAGTRRMYANDDPTRTLKQAFDAFFYPALNLDPEALAPRLARFYAETFHRLRPLTAPRPAAQRLVAAARARGYRLVLATNPIFPQAAILARLRWAGLAPAHFDLIPGYETFHFVKPHPALFAEFLAQLGYPEEPVVMVGNDPEDDIAPARRLGLPTYWVTENPPSELPAPHGAGPLEGVLPWLENTPPEDLLPPKERPEALLYRLQATPAALHTALLAHTSPDEAHRLAATLRHLSEVEAQVHLPTLRRVLAEEDPPVPPVVLDHQAAQGDAAPQNESDGMAALARFAALRQETLTLLKGLSPTEWQRPARHPQHGRIRLLDLVGLIVAHDIQHLRPVTPLG